MNWRLPNFLGGVLLVLPAVAGAAPVTKGPWVQKVSSSSAEVRLELEAAQPASIEVDARTIDDPAPRSFHVLQIASLKPGTRYPFTVHAGGVAMSGAFTTAPRDDSDEPFRFLIYGDNRTDSAAHEAVVRAMTPIKTDFLVHTGDFVENGRVASQWQTFFQIEEPLLRDRCLFSAVGNHELVDGGGEIYSKYFGSGDAKAALDATYRWGNTRFFFLNSLVQYKAGPDRAWLEKVLGDADREPGIVWRIAVMHHSPWSSGPHGDNVYLRDAGVPQLLRAHQVDLVVAGHDHIYERGYENHTAYLVSGGGGAPTYRIKQPRASARRLESVRHFIVATVEKDKIGFEMIRVDGSIIEKCGLTKDGWDCDKGAAPLPNVAIEANDSPTPGTPRPSPQKKSKCGCRLPGGSTEGWPFLTAIGVVVLAARRRMQRCAR